MFHPFLLALALVLCLGVTTTRAETPEEQNACFNDAQRICPEAIPDRQRVVACLTRNKGRLSRTCRTAMDRDFRPGARSR